MPDLNFAGDHTEHVRNALEARDAPVAPHRDAREP
jgi:hypothetical protein